MKTILLCTLVTIAAAVPTIHHETLQGEELALEHLPVTIQRERKSPLHDHHAAGLSTEAGTEDLHTQSRHKLSTMEGRSLGFKKPIIVKKKIGYHVYRDSDEEMAHADPHENCNKQVKVKLCEDESGSPKSMGACFVSERLNEDISEKEIENSIKTAKKAVENLQRGFHKMEHNSAKLAKVEDKEFEDDMVVHQHIDAARKALEHVHRNFGHLETSDSQAISPKLEGFQSKSSDEERLAQWKAAIDNIHKNFEIARNIEDAFKADSEQMNLESTHTDESSKIRDSEHIESNLDSQHKFIPAISNNAELPTDESNTLIKQRENTEIDMFTAPTDHKELEVKLHSDSLRSEKITEEVLDDHESKTINTEKSKEHIPTMKTSEITTTADGTSKTENIKSENLQEVIDHVHSQKSKAANDINLENQNDEKFESNTHDLKEKTEKNAPVEIEDMSTSTKDATDTANDKVNLAKSAHIESLDTKHDKHDMSMAASHVSSHQSHMETKHSVNTELEKSINKEEPTMGKTIGNEKLEDNTPKSKSVTEVNEKHKEEPTHPNDKFQERMSHESLSTPVQGNTKHIEPTPIKVAEFNNMQHNINDDLMRMFGDQNEDHKLNEQPISDMRMTEDQKYHAFLMRWANENQLRVPESTLSLAEDLTAPTHMSELNNGQNLHDVHPSMRLNHDHKTEHLSQNHEQVPLFKQWANENQQNQLQIPKTANDFHERMKFNQHQNMQNQVTDDHNLHDLFSMRLAQEKQLNENLRHTPEFHNGHLHAPLDNSLVHDMSQLGPRMHERFHMMKQAMTDMDSSMQPSMHMGMRDSIGKPSMEHNDMHWNHHHHAMARYGSGLPVTSSSSGAVGLFPNANTGGCGIPLMLSCSPNVVSGTLAKAQPHPGTITPPAYRSGDDLVYYMKRDAKDTKELPTLKIQKSSLPFTHKSELIFDKSP